VEIGKTSSRSSDDPLRSASKQQQQQGRKKKKKPYQVQAVLHERRRSRMQKNRIVGRGKENK